MDHKNICSSEFKFWLDCLNSFELMWNDTNAKQHLVFLTK